MLAVFDLVFLAATVANQVLNVVALAKTDIEAKPDVAVYAIDMKQQTPMWVDKCHYQGLMVRYARDWEETNAQTGVVLPAEPDKPVGYALILLKEQCPNSPERAIFKTGSKFFYPIFSRGYVIREGHRIDALDYGDQRDDLKPKWMAQVLKTIDSESANNPAASAFVAELTRRKAAMEEAGVKVE